MDTTDPEIVFDEHGNCNHCNEYFIIKDKILKHGPEGQRQLDALVAEIKEKGKNKKYDCIIGLSGGVDSTYVAYKIKELGLRPLAIHFDSGWNSELAVKNIENIIKKLGFDLYTFVCDWKEMKDLQLSYFKAGVINADIPMDHAFMVVLYRMARKYGVKYFISGHNFETEAILPKAWVYQASDGHNVKGIQKAVGKVKLSKYPVGSIYETMYTNHVFGLNKISLLDYERYDKQAAMSLIEKELGWKYYGGKHYESIFTRFYQGYYLVKRFGIDKRRAHLSTLICSNQLSREEAIKELQNSPYTDIDLLNSDMEFIPKKLGITVDEFKRIMDEPIRDHLDFPNDRKIRTLLSRISRFIKRK